MGGETLLRTQGSLQLPELSLLGWLDSIEEGREADSADAGSWDTGGREAVSEDTGSWDAKGMEADSADAGGREAVSEDTGSWDAKGMEADSADAWSWEAGGGGVEGDWRETGGYTTAPGMKDE